MPEQRQTQNYGYQTQEGKRTGNEKVVQDLRPLYRIAVISNFTADLDEVLDQIGLRSYFELVVNSSKVGIRKPDDRIYMLACNLLDVNPAESVFIDDNHDNFITAQRVGMNGILSDQLSAYESSWAS